MAEKKYKRKGKKKSAWSVFFKPIRIILSIFFILVVLGCAAGGVVYMKYSDEINACRDKAQEIISSTKREDFSQPSDTRIYDSDGEIIGTINSGHYEYVKIGDISKNLQNAYIAQEDRRFLEHHGIDYIGVARAGLTLIKNKGEITQGGSSITQQIIKNTYLTQERSFERKITELFAAPEMEKIYTKNDIMEFYCNTNFYANRCYGVAKASRYYFDKEAKDLTVWEAATLAGISNNPSRYDPVARPENALKKRNQVIDSMLECKMITGTEASFAKAQPLTVEKIYEGGATKDNYATSYAVHCAAQELMKNEGFVFEYVFQDKEEYESYRERYQELYQAKSDLIRNGGFEIYTSIDSRLQNTLQETLDQDLSGFDQVQDNGKYALQGAAVTIDNKTGYVVAIVGGRGTDDEYNRGFLSRRQPGSTIKPLIDYAPAFETGFYYPSRLVNDHLFEDGPKNSSGKYHGEVSVREALNRSLNTVAWQVLEDIGVNKGIGYLGKLHFVGLSYMDNGNASMSIGGFTEGARVVDMAKGYSTLANGGMYSNKTCIRGIVSQYEGEVYQGNQADERVFSEDTAYILTDVLKGTLDKPYGTGYGLGLSIPSAGKTGTTNSNKDTWFCGYTKYHTTAVWVGYDTPKAMPGIFGKTYAGKIWHNFMAVCSEGLEPEDWQMPATVSLSYVDGRGEKTDQATGQKDLFSSVLEANARADSEKWAEEERLKKEQRQLAAAQQAALDASRQAADQQTAEFQAALADLNNLSYQDDTVQDKINRATALLEGFAGTESYEGLKQQLDAAVSRAQGLPNSGEWEKKKWQEYGPGYNDPTTAAPGPDSSPVAGPAADPETGSPESPGSGLVVPAGPGSQE